MEDAYQLQVIITAGPEDPRKAILGLSMAAAAASAGARVYVYLVMEAARCLLKEYCGRELVPTYPTVSELVAVVHEAEGTVAYCPNCLESGCVPASEMQAEVQVFCHLARAGGISPVGMRLTSVPTVVF
jgi:predicted peroxiredoxin